METKEKLIVSLDEIKMNNRFNLEEEIQKVWNTEEDLDTILYRIMDAPEIPSEDEIVNMLIGLKEIHKSRCLKLLNVFETMLENKKIID
jgi:hypothetical protein